jgi:hypothetical protein
MYLPKHQISLNVSFGDGRHVHIPTIQVHTHRTLHMGGTVLVIIKHATICRCKLKLVASCTLQHLLFAQLPSSRHFRDCYNSSYHLELLCWRRPTAYNFSTLPNLEAGSIISEQGELYMSVSWERETAITLTRATRRNNPEDTILHSHRRENLKSYSNYTVFCNTNIWTYTEVCTLYSTVSFGTLQRVLQVSIFRVKSPCIAPKENISPIMTGQGPSTRYVFLTLRFRSTDYSVFYNYQSSQWITLYNTKGN